ncbi:MAG TPA: hypothetical protein VG518_06705, partial [Solirubrobacterales bacterium]|nr:hypothetical protein [Solirubrobacterales bacterium]
MRTAEADIATERGPAVSPGPLVETLASTPVLGAALGILTWPLVSILPASGPDPSWLAGLYMAHGEGLQFGKEIVFTYGPLGFLQSPVLYSEILWALAFLFQAALHLGVAISLLYVGRRSLPLPLAALACYCLLVIGSLEASAVLIAFIWCFLALEKSRPRRASFALIAAGGALAAIELLVKANYGVTVLVLVALTVLGLEGRRRNLPVFAVALLGTFGACWLLAGQDLSGLPAFLSHSAQMIAGYSDAMGTNIIAVPWERWAAIGAIALTVGATALASRGGPLPRRLATLGLVVVFSFTAFKQGFVRQGLGNTPEFFVLIACAGLTVASRLPRTALRGAALALTVPLIGLALAVLPTPSLEESLKPQA